MCTFISREDQHITKFFAREELSSLDFDASFPIMFLHIFLLEFVIYIK